MNITHICLTGSVNDNWTYQDNLLTKFHKKMGHNVTIITSQWVFMDNGNVGKDNRKCYVNDDGVEVIRLPICNGDSLNNKFKCYRGLKAVLEETKPQVLFIHNLAFLDMRIIVKFLKRHRDITVYVDNHADFSNSATNWISKHILHGIIWRHYAKKIEPYVKRFYGVLPARVDFLTEIYGIPGGKVELLVMGGDDEVVNMSLKSQIREGIRENHGISKDDFLIVTGGKIDEAKKQILFLMDAVNNIPDKTIKLIVFGSIVPSLKNEVEQRCSEKVQYIGWLESSLSNNYFAAADLVVFPGRHSVFWEQAVALGIPMIVKYWEGTTHVDIGGNVKFLYEDNAAEIQSVIETVVEKDYSAMKNISLGKRREKFLYSSIAKQAIRDVFNE